MRGERSRRERRKSAKETSRFSDPIFARTCVIVPQKSATRFHVPSRDHQ